ncbi:MAG: hypothetical protein ACLQOO_18260 [Terriglobia bacterium]
MKRLFSLLACMGLISAPLGCAQTSVIANLPLTTRAEMIATAKKLASHAWTCGAPNLQASCGKNYRCDWKPGQRVAGIPYCWGGVDGPDAFDRRLAKGLAAGAHSRYGVLSCATGIDCSGFICLCWGLALSGHAYSTSNLRLIAGKPKYNWFTDMKPGDVLNKAGSHVVMFAGYNRDGTINVYEASGSAARVIFHRTTWSRYKGYIPLQYKAVDE